MLSRRFRFALLGLMGLLLLGVGVALAGGGVSDKIHTGGSFSVGADETVSHDLYVFVDTTYMAPEGWQGDVVVDGTVEGDLIAGAGRVTINGTVHGDLLAGAGVVEINGEVAGDVRAGSGDLTIAGTVGEDVVAGAGTLIITETGDIGEDLIFLAGNVQVDGSVAGNVLGTASTYVRSGTVGGTEIVTLDRGGAPLEPGEPPSEPVRIAGDALRQWVTVLFFGGLGLLLVPGAVRASESALRRRPLASAGIGLGLLLGYLIQFIAVILLMILLAIAFGSVTLDALAGISIWLGILDLFVTTFALVVSAAFLVDMVVGLALAQLVERGWAKSRWQEYTLLALGALIVVAATSLPGIGGVVKLVVILLGLGAMGVAFGEWWSRRRPPATPPFTPAAVGLATALATAPATAAVTAPEAPAAPEPPTAEPPAPEKPPSHPPGA
ncbi:MAG TPA: polymer-forming cytoskeletal protein [Candidatus Limnocylindria bacterium]|nr:polymer-forming cytoskeletal protein [Candidatus Limnocylindria bacterium]